MRTAFFFPLALAAALSGLAEEPRPITTVVPTEHNSPLVNPYMGWGIWAGPKYLDGRPFTIDYNTKGFGDDAPLFNWVLIDWMWADLEPSEGNYNWKDLDSIITYWGERKKQIYLRVWITDDPGWDNEPGNEVFPQWLYGSGMKFRDYLSQGKFKKKEPDYLDPTYESIYLRKAGAFLKALAARYDKPGGSVFMWGAMGYGQWGEWHTLWSHYPWTGKDAKHAVLAKIVDMYAGIFKQNPVMISYCPDTDHNQVTSIDDFLYRQALDVALAKNFALARHGFIDGLVLYDTLTMQKYWRTSPMLAEGNWTYQEVKDERTHGTLAENIAVFEDWHSNFGHFYMDADSYRRGIRDDRAAFEDSLRSGGLGYRLVATSVSYPTELHAGELFIMRSTWVNRNVGRLYVHHPFRVYLTDSQGRERFSAVDRSFTETNWVRGEEYPMATMVKTPENLEPGTYDLRIAMTGPDGKPAIRLAIGGEDEQLRYRIGTIRVVPPYPKR